MILRRWVAETPRCRLVRFRRCLRPRANRRPVATRENLRAIFRHGNGHRQDRYRDHLAALVRAAEWAIQPRNFAPPSAAGIHTVPSSLPEHASPPERRLPPVDPATNKSGKPCAPSTGSASGRHPCQSAPTPGNSPKSPTASASKRHYTDKAIRNRKPLAQS